MAQNDLGPRYVLAAREDKLVQQIFAALDTVQRVSEGKYQELLRLLATARIPVARTKLQKANLEQLRAAWLLIRAFMDDALAAKHINIGSSYRCDFDQAGIDTGVTANTTQPFTMLNAAGVEQECFVSEGGAGGVIFGAFEPDNLTGTTANFAQIHATSTSIPYITKLTDHSALARISDALVNQVWTLTLDASGAPQVAATVLDAAITEVGDNIAVTRDFTDGTYLWCLTGSTAGTDLRVHKLNLATGVEEGYVTINDTVDPAASEPVVFADGDDFVVVCEDSTSAGDFYAVFGSIADGSGAAGPVDADTGTLLEDAGASDSLLQTMVSAPSNWQFGRYTELRLFMQPTTKTLPMKVVDLSPSAGTATLTDISGTTAPAEMTQVIRSADDKFLMAFDGTSDLMVLYDLVGGEEASVSALPALFSAINTVSPMVVGEHGLLNADVGTGGAETFVKVGVE